MTLPEFDRFSVFFQTAGMNIDRQAYDRMLIYSDLLVEYNKVMNLTGITDPEGIMEKHLLDSLLIFKYCDIPENAAVIDVGTGAGFPGVPMKLYRPDLDVTLLDSLNKRIKFLSEVANKTLPMKCVHSRAEDGGRDKQFREKFDIAAARAVAPLRILAEYCIPYVKVGGEFIAMKGPNEDIHEGENAVKILGGEISDIIDYALPCGDRRVIVRIKKIQATTTKYPRNSSQISKNML